jgi:hypothetical protein
MMVDAENIASVSCEAMEGQGSTSNSGLGKEVGVGTNLLADIKGNWMGFLARSGIVEDPNCIPGSLCGS